MLAVAFGLLLLLGGGIGFAIWKINDSSKDAGAADPDSALAANTKGGPEKSSKDSQKPDPEEKKKPPKEAEPKTIEEDDVPKDKTPKDDGKPGLKRKDPPKVLDKEPEIGPITKIETPKKVIPGIDQEKIDQAISRGVAFLKRTQKANGSWEEFNYPVGLVALSGLTLLESKTPANDPSVEGAAAFVRANAARVGKNYDASTAILFLDRLGDKRDRPLIQALALRVLAGQLEDGGWTYQCAVLQPQEMQQLLDFLQSHKQPNAKNPIRAETLSPNLRRLQVVQNQGKLKGKHALYESFSDNSNTQFALLALWAARRHGVPTEQAILASFDRFMVTQCNDGGWSYFVKASEIAVITAPGSLGPPLAANRVSTNTMTCVGLLGLALGHGVSPDIVGANPDNPKQPIVKPALQDEKIQKGLEALARHIGEPVDAGSLQSLRMQDLYYLWCIERVAMLYHLSAIGGKDWYGWGAQNLVTRQQGDGSWTSSSIHMGNDRTVNTCFALLFLQRSNLVADLTVNLRLHSGIRDPEK